MRSGLGLIRQLRKFHTRYNLFCFTIRKRLLGFEMANQFIQRVDKESVQFILKKNGANIGKNCDLETGITFHNCKDYSHLIIGNNCHIGKNCFFDLQDKVEIGNNVVISMQCTFITHINMNQSPLSERYPASASPIVIHDNVYLGANVTVLMGVRINKDALVAAKSLVRNSVERSAVVAGIPAKSIQKDIQGH